MFLLGGFRGVRVWFVRSNLVSLLFLVSFLNCDLEFLMEFCADIFTNNVAFPLWFPRKLIGNLSAHESRRLHVENFLLRGKHDGCEVTIFGLGSFLELYVFYVSALYVSLGSGRGYLGKDCVRRVSIDGLYGH